jgi:hypothetical protein
MADDKRGLSPQQAKLFAAVREGLENETGRSLVDWAALVRETCPETAHAKRLAWLRDVHGFGKNRASRVLDRAFGSLGCNDPDALADQLWTTPDLRAIVAAVRAAVTAWPGVTEGQRKPFTAFSRKSQFAALAPVKTTGARLGLAVLADEDPLLEPPRRREAWSDRLRSVLVLDHANAVDERALRLLQRAYKGF